MRTIASKWEEFKNNLPEEAPPDILGILEHTFYAGVASYIELESEVDCDPNISGDASIAIMQGIHEELQLFFDVKV